MKILVLLSAYLYVACSQMFKDDSIGKNARALTKDYAIVLVTRDGCGHCKNLEYFEEASQTNAKVDFVKLDAKGKTFGSIIAALNLNEAPHLRATPMFYLLKRTNGKLGLVKDSVGTGNIKKQGLDKLLEGAK